MAMISGYWLPVNVKGDYSQLVIFMLNVFDSILIRLKKKLRSSQINHTASLKKIFGWTFVAS